MRQKIEFIPFKSTSDKGWNEAWALYEAAFPLKESRSLADHLRALEDPLFSADGIWRDEQFVGIFFYWKCAGYYYGEHLAISPALRGQDIGSTVLAAFCDMAGRVILEIEPPVDDLSIRRLHFYQRAGFTENPHEYIHPSFREPFEPHKLVLMSYPYPIDADITRKFERFVHDTVLKYSEHHKD
ncbi:MAG: GNAT family N-acetyltransferase [Alistipes sp.]